MAERIGMVGVEREATRWGKGHRLEGGGKGEGRKEGEQVRWRYEEKTHHLEFW